MNNLSTSSVPPAVFVIDDDPSVRRSLGRLLGGEGWHVETFEKPTEFLERAPFQGNGCVLLDERMPEMAGTEVHGAMLARGETLPVVFLTAHGDLPTAVGSMKRGAADFLAKPADEKVLLGTLREALERHAHALDDRRRRAGVKAKVDTLTRRQREVLSLVIAGRLNKQIAHALGISIKTVKVHRARVMQHLEARSLAALLHACEMIGLTHTSVADANGPPGQAASRFSS